MDVAVQVPVVATGGIADERGVAAALMLGASAAQVGTAFLVCPEAMIHPAWAKALTTAAPENTMVSRVFSGRAGRSLETDYVRAATAPDAPRPAPIRYNAGLRRPCGQKRRRRAISNACRYGRDNPQASPEWNRRDKLCEGSGRERRRC